MNSIDKQLFKQVQLFGDYRWIKSPDTVSDGYVLTYDNTSGLWVASAPADTSNLIQKPSSPVSGDFLAYNGANWVAGTPSETYIASFSAYSTASITFGTSYGSDKEIIYSAEKIKDTSYYAHTTGSAGITVLEAGDYFIQADASSTIAGDNTYYAVSYLTKNGTEISGTRAILGGGTSGAGSSSTGIMLSLATNDVIKHIVSYAGTGTSLTGTTITNGCRMNITTIVSTGVVIPVETAPSFNFSTAEHSMYLSLI